jgi:cell division topological specificity factor
MIEWVKKVFGAPTSSSTAKERLRLVLMTDHLALAPEIIENMKRDLVDVISRYVEVDRDKVEVNFEREDRALAMLANIPIVSVNRPSPPPEPAKPAPTAPHAGPPPRRRRRKKPPTQNPATAH